MDLRLEEKRVFVSGSTEGIGFAVARACLAEGASVVVNGRTEEGVARAVTRLADLVPGGTVSGLAADLADAGRTQDLLDRLGEVDVLVNNVAAVDVPGDMVHYGATKAAALALANGLAKLTRGTGVTVTTVLGGPTWSDGVRRAVEGIAEASGGSVAELRSALVRPTSLVQRFLEPEEIASLVTYLASPRSSATNGATLRADGGVLTTVG